ncbi:MAG: hypothetical protein HFH31_00450 [Bacilli bacterium]|nr:hypothetical protein [Bacilli bacterium]
MKKKLIILGIIAIFIIILLVNVIISNNKNITKLSCRIEKNVTGMKPIGEVNITFKKDIIREASLNTKIELSEQAYMDNIDIVYNALEEQYKDVKKESGVAIKTNKTSNSISVNIKIDARKNPEQVSLIGSNIEGNMNYKDAKAALEKDGYICK